MKIWELKQINIVEETDITVEVRRQAVELVSEVDVVMPV